MAAPRASAFQALRNVQRVSNSATTTRGLHMTEHREAAQRFDPLRKTVYTSWGFQELRNECHKRTLASSGTKPELIDRLSAHDSLQHRAFHMALRRVAKDQQRKTTSGLPNSITFRTFSTSRGTRAINDTSTIDFAYFPKLWEGEFVAEPAAIRVPILPHVESDVAEAVLEKYPELDAAAGGYQNTDAGLNLMKPQIQTVDAAAETASSMSDVHDGHHPQEMSVEMLTKLTDTVNDSAKQIASMVKQESAFRKVWNGLLDDLFGAKTVKT